MQALTPIPTGGGVSVTHIATNVSETQKIEEKNEYKFVIHKPPHPIESPRLHLIYRDASKNPCGP